MLQQHLRSNYNRTAPIIVSACICPRNISWCFGATHCHDTMVIVLAAVDKAGARKDIRSQSLLVKLIAAQHEVTTAQGLHPKLCGHRLIQLVTTTLDREGFGKPRTKTDGLRDPTNHKRAIAWHRCAPRCGRHNPWDGIDQALAYKVYRKHHKQGRSHPILRGRTAP